MRTDRTTHKSGGKTYTTEKTTYSDGSSKSVTREGSSSGPFPSGKVRTITTTDPKGNSRTERP